MSSARIPAGTWTWRRTGLVLGVVLVPVLALSTFATSDDRLASTARLGGVIVSPAALVAAVACYAAWRVNPRPGLAWTSFAIALLGCQGLMLAAVQLLEFPRPVEELWVLAADVTIVLVGLFALTIGQRTRFHPDPAAAGFALGAFVAVLRLAWLDGSPHLGHDLPHAPVAAVAVAAFVVAALGILRTRSIALWARQRTALTILLIGGAHLALYLGDNAVAHAVTVAGDTLGAALIVSTSLSLFFTEVEVDAENRSNLNDELERAQARIMVHRGQLHELNSTIAGITSASRLLRSADGISDERRDLLADMIASELGRLERLMSEPADGSEPRLVDLDETVGHLVVSHEARGHHVRWSPSGVKVTAQPDAISEVVNILLDNAAKHAGSTAEVRVEQIGDTVEIAVHDDGPGVEESLRRRIFDWGARGTRSTGQGIGLHIAHELMQRQGGYLEIRDGRWGGGATFVLGLPASGLEAPPGDRDDARDDDEPPAAELA
ncbi:Signal transduction histidine kinase [Nocardioides terrae]|uniref:histidine kinase n=1 Tax=Nocardioides terrae TaxID=574651 RepID=A0A1I1I219_9ACTN|nr:HAMP domain-containing sensor histidine kinase [Nocardioides terrae]SFC27733.1 Signal transduction histidine kinase [Nocardioides terrae]